MPRRQLVAGLGVPGPVPALVAEAAPRRTVTGKHGTLAGIMRTAIADGRWPVDSGLPSERTLAATFAVSRGTVRAALGLLAAEGRIRRHPRRAMVVTRSADPDTARRRPPRLRAALVLAPERLANPVIQAVVAACHDHLDPGIALEVYIHERPHPELYQAHGAGLVLLDGFFGRRAINAVAASGMPVAVINAFHPHLPYAFTDNRLGGMLMARHVLERGHRHIAVLHHDTERAPDDFIQRLRGIRHEMQAAGIQPQELCCGFGGEASRSLAQRILQLLRNDPRLSVLLCLTDSLALRALETLNAAGIAVPDQISLVGYDDLPAVRFTRPPLTSVRQPVDDLGAALAALALRVAVGGEARLDRPISPVLVPRSSVADQR